MAAGTKVEIRNIPLNKIKLGRNSRLSVSKEELAGLMQSIKEQGLFRAILRGEKSVKIDIL
jgi:ParB-like chromosome segregation protein Spo0J